MLGIVIPVHNEEACLERCLRSVMQAAEHGVLCTERVRIVVVLDACTDGSRQIAQRYPVTIISVNARNVGIARAAGAEHLVQAGARWIACTDADSWVPADWLVAQLAYDVDAVCGVVDVEGWDEHSPEVRTRYLAGYDDAEDHPHIHGANLGIATPAYVRAGGFPALAAHEDVHLVRKLEELGGRIAWSGSVRVKTSARLDCRAQQGMGQHLRSLANGA
jgi:glycosyltransferase involved in cell wall biosynthesis